MQPFVVSVWARLCAGVDGKWEGGGGGLCVFKPANPAALNLWGGGEEDAYYASASEAIGSP